MNLVPNKILVISTSKMHENLMLLAIFLYLLQLKQVIGNLHISDIIVCFIFLMNANKIIGFNFRYGNVFRYSFPILFGVIIFVTLSGMFSLDGIAFLSGFSQYIYVWIILIPTALYVLKDINFSVISSLLLYVGIISVFLTVVLFYLEPGEGAVIPVISLIFDYEVNWIGSNAKRYSIGSPNTMGFVLCVVWVLGVSVMSKHHYWLKTFLYGLLTIGIVISASRAAFVFLVASTIFVYIMAFINYTRGKKFVMFCVIFLIALIFMYFIRSYDLGRSDVGWVNNIRRMLFFDGGALEAEMHDSGRVGMLLSAFNFLENRPFLGVGINNYINWTGDEIVHVFPILFWIEGGLGAVLLIYTWFLMMIYMLILDMRNKWKKHNDYLFAVKVSALFFGWLIWINFMTEIYNRIFWVPVIFVLLYIQKQIINGTAVTYPVTIQKTPL